MNTLTSVPSSRKVAAAVVVATMLFGVASPVQADSADGSIVYMRWRLPHQTCCYADIYSIAPDGSGERAITDDGFYSEVAPAVSPDGSKIAYATNRGGIHIADREGTVLSKIGVRSAYWPTWSPDGRRLAFHMYREKSGYSIAVSEVDGTKVRRITSGRMDVAPEWSPDGKWIVFSRWGAQDGVEASQLYLTKPDGSFLRLLTTGSISAFKGTWSPDGRSIAFEGYKFATTAALDVYSDDIYVISVATGKLMQITSGGDYDVGPCWSPDGTQLAFSRSPLDAGVTVPPPGNLYAYYGAAADLFVMNVDGTQLKQLTTTPHVSESYCDWSPGE